MDVNGDFVRPDGRSYRDFVNSSPNYVHLPEDQSLSQEDISCVVSKQ